MNRRRFLITTAGTAALAIFSRCGMRKIVKKRYTGCNYNFVGDEVYAPKYGGANGPETGLFQGNGDLFTSFWNSSHELTWSVGKTDVWDRRYFGDSKRVVTIDEIRHLAFHGDPRISRGLLGSAHALYQAYDFPCPKPVGQIILRAPQFEKTDDLIPELDKENGLLQVKVRKDDAGLKVDGFVYALRNVMIFDVSYVNAIGPLCFELYRHRDTLERGKTVMELSGSYGHFEYDYDQDPGNGPVAPPEVGTDGEFFWIRQRFHADTTFPEGFEVVMMAMIPDADYTVAVHENILAAGAKVPLRDVSAEELRTWHGAHREKRFAIEMVNNAPGWLASAQIDPAADGSFTAYVSVMTTRDADNPLTAARRELEKAIAGGYQNIETEHRKWWASYSSRSTIKVSDPQLNQKRFSGSHYGLGWSRRSGKVPLYNSTTPLFTDATPWHGDYHFNEIWFHTIMIANHCQTLLPWLEMLEEILPMAQTNAREVYDCRGCCYTLIHYPIKGKRLVYCNQSLELGMEITAMVLKPFWQYYKFTGDLVYLREHAYPIIREGARFYADYVSKGEDGCYHIIPTVSQENWGLTPKFEKNKDSVGALSQVRYHLLACVEAAEKLSLDREERENWSEIALNMAPYPTYMTDEGPIFVDVRDNTPEPRPNLFADLSMVFWGDQIHIDANPALIEIARRTFDMMYYKDQHLEFGKRGHRLHYYRAIERRLGLERTIDYFDVEDLLMSFTGRMYLFIGVPEDEDVRFDRLLAWGGFEVSAEKKAGRVSFMQVKSVSGESCRFVNPWHPNAPAVTRVSDSQQIAIEVSNDTISFDTVTNEVYQISESV